MVRVGATTDATGFAEMVAECYRIVEPVADAEVQERFRSGRAYQDFRAALQETRVKADARVLAIGCGRGLAGRGASYAAAVIREVHPAAVIDEVNYTAGAAPPGTAYDMVVTHSILHFALDPAPLCRFVLSALTPRGCYVMADEPNARFWANAECVAALERVSAAETRRRRLRRYADPSRYVGRLLRAVRQERSRDVAAEVNRLLRERLGTRGDLTENEILRIVDPHAPDRMRGEYRLGSDGLDWDWMAAGPLADLELKSVRTSGYVMRDNPARIPERWRELDRELAERFPLDGCCFTALWQGVP